MAKYPPTPAGLKPTGDLLQLMLPQIAYKLVTESVTSSTVLQNDNDLFVPVAANSTYLMELLLLHDSDNNAAADIDISWTGPTGATMNWGVHGANINETGSSGTITATNMQTRLINEEATFGGGDSTGTTAFASGLLITSGTAGTLQLQWAQNTSNAVATNVRAGSWLKLTQAA